MAYESGYEVKNYIGGCIDKYKKDSLIFSKAAHLITLFMARSDWPHCYDEMDKAVMEVLGDSLTGIIFGFTQRYLNDERMQWPENMPPNFREELSAFHLATDTVVSQFWMGRTNPMRLFSIAQSFDYDDHRIIRFIRMDGAFLDIEIDKIGIEEAIRMLNELEALKEET